MSPPLSLPTNKGSELAVSTAETMAKVGEKQQSEFAVLPTTLYKRFKLESCRGNLLGLMRVPADL
jgi:hypothetical protein